MAKNNYKRLDSVKDLLSLQAIFEVTQAKLESNRKWLEKKYGNRGGTEDMPDGSMIFTRKEENGRQSTQYAKAWDEAKQLIRDGKLHRMSKDDLLTLFVEIEKKWTNPQFASQKVIGELVESKITESL
jgi:hypothetical protein